MSGREGSRVSYDPRSMERNRVAFERRTDTGRLGMFLVVFMGLREPKLGGEANYVSRINELTGDLPTVILVCAAGPFAGQLIQ